MKQQVEKIKINEKEDEVEINLLDLFNYYRKKILFIIAGFLIGAIIAGVWTKVGITPNILQQRKFIWFQHQKTQWSILLI